jgi:predicted glycosyltransferase
MKDLQSHFDLRGSVKEVSQNYAEITIGKYHGVKPDTRLVAFAPEHRTLDKTENKSTRQELVVREIKDFTCIAEASDTESLRVGMLVRQKHGKANK